MNKAILLGNLGADPEMRFTSGGGAVANFRIATSETWNDRQSGERQERTEWHRIVVWGKQAELCGEYLRKGRSVLVEGRIQTREWTDKEGQKRYTTEIVADRVTFIGGRDGGGGERSSGDEYQRGGRRGGGGGGGDEYRRGGGGAGAAQSNAGGYDDRGGGGGGGSQDDAPPLGDDDIPF